MKPTPELINDWHEKARQMAIQADGYFDDVEHWRHFAELAAAWGAKQAQHGGRQTNDTGIDRIPRENSGALKDTTFPMKKCSSPFYLP